MDKRTFWSAKSPLPEWHAVTFSHPSFSGPIRLVANQFAEVKLGGEVHMPAPMSIKAPESKGDSQPKLTLVFPRQVVGREFKSQLQRVTDSGSREPVSVLYQVYLGVTNVPQLAWTLYAAETGGVIFDRDSVQVVATDDNPMRRPVAPLYDPSVFTGLEVL